jgi:hypothetical protein
VCVIDLQVHQAYWVTELTKLSPNLLTSSIQELCYISPGFKDCISRIFIYTTLKAPSESLLCPRFSTFIVVWGLLSSHVHVTCHRKGASTDSRIYEWIAMFLSFPPGLLSVKSKSPSDYPKIHSESKMSNQNISQSRSQIPVRFKMVARVGNQKS